MLPRYRLRWNTMTSGTTEKMIVSPSVGRMNEYAVVQWRARRATGRRTTGRRACGPRTAVKILRTRSAGDGLVALGRGGCQRLRRRHRAVQRVLDLGGQVERDRAVRG